MSTHIAAKTTHLLPHGFCGSGLQTQFSWVFCPGSHQAVIMVSTRLWSYLQAQLRENLLPSSLRPLADIIVIELRASVSHRLLARGQTQPLEAACSPLLRGLLDMATWLHGTNKESLCMSATKMVSHISLLEVSYMSHHRDMNTRRPLGAS